MKEQEKSDSTWDEGLEILSQGMVNSAASRLYYAVFMAPFFYFLKRHQIQQNDPGLHGKVRNLAASHVKGKEKCRDTMSTLFDLRIRADYTPEEIEEYELDEKLREDGNRIRKYFLQELGKLEQQQ